MHTKTVFTTGEVANLLHIHQTTVIDWAKKDLVKNYKTPGGHRRILKESLLSFLHAHNMPLPAELEPRDRSTERPTLQEHRRPKNVKL